VKNDAAPGSIKSALVAPGGDDPTATIPWGTAFLVDGRTDRPITLVQVTAKDFCLCNHIQYVGETGLDKAKFPDLATALQRDPCDMSVAHPDTSDLASIPRFFRWFENTYGRHTPAALIHDNLISPTPNGGPLHDDAASDRLFRFMLQAVGVPFFKRWIMWAAVAYRTRWAVGGLRRAALVVWVLLAAAGIVSFIWAIVALATGGDGPGGINAWLLVGIALVGPLVAGILWQRQWGAALVTAAGAPFVLPPAVIAALGYTIYWLLERAARALDIK
jgi:hypothetical protein